MSAPSESSPSQAPCACTNISLMQLFHELKQKFPGVPDHVVSNTIELYCHDKQACEKQLLSEVKASLTHAYHASSSAAARRLSQPQVTPPPKCRNQPVVKHEALKPTAVNSIRCPEPQKAILSTAFDHIKSNTDANQNIVEARNENTIQDNDGSSPITVINIDNCHVKYSVDSPSDQELTNDNAQEVKLKTEITQDRVSEQPESTNYRILKSCKIRSNLNERLEKGKEKKTIKKEEIVKEEIKKEPVLQEKPVRPNTLNFIKPKPDIAFKPTLSEEPEPCRTISPAPKVEALPKDSKSHRPPHGGYPLNLSVNVNCHMDLSRGYDPWSEFESPHAITSVNLTVCTPTSNMASPVRDPRDPQEDGFEGHVTVTVSPSTPRPNTIRRAPPPPPPQARIDSPRPARAAPEPPGTTHDRSLIERQKERLNRLAKALAQHKGQLNQMSRETKILAAPTPSMSTAQRLRDYVEMLRDQCDTLAKRLEMTGNEPEDSRSFYTNIYTGQRPSASWQCTMCTFRNHPLLDKCEQCDMPRIFVGTSPPETAPRGLGLGSLREDRVGVKRDQTQGYSPAGINRQLATGTATPLCNHGRVCQ